jgi:type IV pilus assembly protein PilX
MTCRQEQRIMQKRFQNSSDGQKFNHRQSGVVLVISLIMLMVLTMIGLSSTRISGLEVLMGVNTQDTVVSLMIAEDSAFAGEQRILANFGGPPTFDLTADQEDGLYLDANLVINTVDWEVLIAEEEARDDEPPREYIIEYIGPRIVPGRSLGVGTGTVDDKRFMYRVSGRGESNRGSARVVQTIYALRAL